MSCFLYCYFNIQFLQRYCIKVASIFVNGGTLLQISIEVIHYPLITALEGNTYPLTKDQSVLATLWQICAICKSCQYPLRNSSEDCQKLATSYKKFARGLAISSYFCNKFARGLPTTYGTFTRGLPQLHTKGQLLCNTSEESKAQS